MLENKFIVFILATSLAVGCFAKDETVVIESSTNQNLVKVLRLHEDVMLKLIHKSEQLEKELNELKKQNAQLEELKNKSSSANKNSTVSSKYDKEFRAYIEASKNAK